MGKSKSLGLNVLGFSASGLSSIQNLKHFSGAQVFSNPAYRFTTGFIIGADALADTVGSIHNGKILFDEKVPTQDRVLALVNIIFFASRAATAVRTKFRTSDPYENAKYSKHERMKYKKRLAEAQAKAKKQEEEAAKIAAKRRANRYKKVTEMSAEDAISEIIRDKGIIEALDLKSGYASKQHKATSKVIERELKNINFSQVDLLEASLQKGQYIVDLDPFKGAPSHVYSYGVKKGLKSISLGTAREFTERTGREIAMIYDTKYRRNTLVIGGKSSVDIVQAMYTRRSDFTLIWHTHPGKSNDVYLKDFDIMSTYASDADSLILLYQKNNKSIVIPKKKVIDGTDQFSFVRIFSQEFTIDEYIKLLKDRIKASSSLTTAE